MSTAKKRLSIVVPVYNEATRLHHLEEIHTFFSKLKLPFELIVVNDGSTDNTLALLKKYQRSIPLRILSLKKNAGKGAALKRGMLAARAPYRLFMDIDLSTPLTEFHKFKPLLKKYDVLIGSRKTKGARVHQRQPFLREFFGKGFTALSQFILGTHLTDFTCGFKIFSAKAAQRIFSDLTIRRWGFDSESLFLARLHHFSIKEIPVSWHNDPKSRVNLFKDIPRSLHDLLTIRYNHLKGLYSK